MQIIIAGEIGQNQREGEIVYALQSDLNRGDDLGLAALVGQQIQQE